MKSCDAPATVSRSQLLPAIALLQSVLGAFPPAPVAAEADWTVMVWQGQPCPEVRSL